MSLARKSLSAGRQPRGGLRPVRGRNARNRNRKRRESRLTAGPPVEKILRQIENVRGRRRSSPLARLRRRRRRDREYCDTRLQCRFEKIRAQILSSLRGHGVECVLDLDTRESREFRTDIRYPETCPRARVSGPFRRLSPEGTRREQDHDSRQSKCLSSCSPPSRDELPPTAIQLLR